LTGANRPEHACNDSRPTTVGESSPSRLTMASGFSRNVAACRVIGVNASSATFEQQFQCTGKSQPIYRVFCKTKQWVRWWPWLAHTKHQFALALTARGRSTDQSRAEALFGAAASRVGKSVAAQRDNRSLGSASDPLDPGLAAGALLITMISRGSRPWRAMAEAVDARAGRRAPRRACRARAAVSKTGAPIMICCTQEPWGGYVLQGGERCARLAMGVNSRDLVSRIRNSFKKSRHVWPGSESNIARLSRGWHRLSWSR